MLYTMPGADRKMFWNAVQAALDYAPETGLFTWRCGQSNVTAGAVAGSKTKKGYVLIRFMRYQILAHRLAWFWVTGDWPESQIDHKNGVRDDNRWSNLRPATNAQNLLNRGKNANNSSGFKGVSRCRRTGQYHAYVSIEGRRFFLGYHRSAKDAHAAYRAALAQHAPEFGRSS